MKRASPLLLSLIYFLVLSLTSTQFQARADLSVNVMVDQVDHIVQIRNGGLLVINDTITLSVIEGQLTDLSVGFPYEYQFHLDYAFAYEADDVSKSLETKLNYGFGVVGFYGVNVRFSQALSSGSSYSFTVVFVLSRAVSTQVYFSDGEEEVVFKAEFPLYPSLEKNASTCLVSILFPLDFDYATNLEQKGFNFTESTSSSNQILTHVRNNLTAFASEPSWLSFFKTDPDFIVGELSEVQRRVEIERTERVSVVNTYRLLNRGAKLPEITLKLPSGAYDTSAWDEHGTLSFDSQEGTVTFRSPIEQDASTTFTIIYSLPWEDYVERLSSSVFQFSLGSTDNFDWTIRKSTITVTLPEGAEFRSSLNVAAIQSEMQRHVFKQILAFNFENVTPFQDLDLEITYSYLIFWSSFRPTLWTGAFVLVVAIIALLWRRPKPTVTLPSVTIRPEELDRFVEAYEEKRRNMRKLESLEAQARRGKIPRRRYKMRRRTLESRLSVSSRDIAGLKEKLRRTGGGYADMMRQIEVAETELQGVEADIKRTEARYRRGEISAAAYRKLLEDSYRRRDRAKTTIDGVLLRLREEIR